jgi:polyisoprenoid-binding protein YceI
MPTITELLSNPQSAGTWSLVPERSQITFRNKTMWGAMKVHGAFTEFSGDGQITDAQTVFGRIDINTASLDTKIGKRDEHLRSADYFDAKKFPDISVVVTNAESINGDTVDLRAQLTVKGTTAPLPLRVKVAVVDDGAVRLSAQATVDRKDFGVNGNLMGMLTDKVTISGDVVFRRTG